EPATEKELTTSSGARLAYARSLTLRKPATPKGTSSPGGLSTRRADNPKKPATSSGARHLGVQCLQAEEWAYGRDKCRTV
ncbi:hypothetical protein E4U15_007481, partial [Claviceps sp. LM218 group G6]